MRMAVPQAPVNCLLENFCLKTEIKQLLKMQWLRRREVHPGHALLTLLKVDAAGAPYGLLRFLEASVGHALRTLVRLRVEWCARRLRFPWLAPSLKIENWLNR